MKREDETINININININDNDDKYIQYKVQPYFLEIIGYRTIPYQFLLIIVVSLI